MEQLFELFSKSLVENNKDSKKLQLLKLIVKNKKKLEGGKAIYVRFYGGFTGNLRKIEMEDGILRIIIGWKSIIGWESKKKAEFVFNIDNDNLDIVVDREGINFFRNLNLGDVSTERITVFF